MEMEQVSPFFDAIIQGDVESVKAFIKDGQNINESLPNGSTALILAAQHNHDEIVEELLVNNADPTLTTKTGGTALNRAAEHGNLATIQKLHKAGAVPGLLALVMAAREGHLPVVEWCVHQGVDVNGQLPWGFTALMMAARDGRQDVVECLLNHGANPKLKNRDDETALSLAIENDEDDVADILRKAGVDYAKPKPKVVATPADDEEHSAADELPEEVDLYDEEEDVTQIEEEEVDLGRDKEED
ncbi:MAG: ankyrin repeat domain-containing protein [Balneolaceae bacterium]|nr:ankyrin repeat domain-containing protein [Balneolaceae bacterium]MDR9446811.1 ankyrin repeat domain-containing protein [Balneolaceae bacterium]